MSAAKAAELAARAAPGKTLKVVNSKGEQVEVRLEGTDPASVQLAMLQQQVRSTLELVSSLAEHVAQMTRRAEQALSSIDATSEQQKQLSENIERLATVLSCDMVPVYDENGKLVRAYRQLPSGIPQP